MRDLQQDYVFSLFLNFLVSCLQAASITSLEVNTLYIDITELESGLLSLLSSVFLLLTLFSEINKNISNPTYYEVSFLVEKCD